MTWPPERPDNANRIPISTVGALIFNDAGDVLMIRTRKWSDKWGVPGGKIKYGESSLTALIREVKEETSLDVEDVQFVMVQDCIESSEFYRSEHFLLLNYVCRVSGSTTVQLNEEAQAWKWVDPKEALTMELNRPTLILMEKVDEMGLSFEARK